MISGIITAVLLASFVGIAVWAWSARQRERFDEAARLPLDDEPGPLTIGHCQLANEKKSNDCCCARAGAAQSSMDNGQWTMP